MSSNTALDKSAVQGTPQHSGLNPLETRPVGKLLLEYSIPAILGMTIASINQIISSVFIGHGVGPLGLTALGITFPLVNLLVAFCQPIAIGGAAICSIALGRKDLPQASQILGQVLVLEIVAGVLFGVGFYFLLDPLLVFFGATKNTLYHAREYMLALIITAPAAFIMIGLNNVMRASGHPRKAMITALFSALVNCILTPIFVFWLNMGMFGAGIAVAIGQGASCFWLLHHFLRSSSVVRFQKGVYRLRGELVKPILAIGTSPFLLNVGGCLVVILLNRGLLTYGGDLAVGAFGIINRILLLFAMACVGLGQGLQPIIGYNLGARRYNRVKLALKYGLFAGVAMTTAGFLAFQLTPGLLARCFTEHADLLTISVNGLRITGAVFFLVGPQIITAVYFQSIGRASIAVLLSVSRQMLFLIPCILFLPRWFGLDGVWWSLPVSDMMAFLLSSFILFWSFRSPKAPARHVVPAEPREDSVSVSR